MRSIPQSLANKVRLLQQTRGNDADPRLSVVISRHIVPITDYGMFQTSEVGVTGASRASVAVSRPSPTARADRIYIATIINGNAELFVAAFNGYRPPTTWTPVLTINGAADVAVAFEGTYTAKGRRIEFSTVGEPWIFWIDLDGNILGKRITDAGAGEELAGDAVALSAIMGPGNVGLTVSDGLVLAWTTESGAVITRQYFGGIWENPVLQSSFPANAVDIALARTWDYRLSVNLKTADGKVWLINGNSQISGNANLAFLEVSGLSLEVEEYSTIQNFVKNADENIEAALNLNTGVYSLTAPTLMSVENLDDGSGNWGVKLRLVYSGPVHDIAGNADNYVLAAGANFAGSLIEYDPADPDLKTIILMMEDFNNGSSEATLNYTQGTVDSGPGVTLLPNHSKAVSLVNLVPTTPPAVESIRAINNRLIVVRFDGPISSVNLGANVAALSINGNEPLYSPGGALNAASYAIESLGGELDHVVPISVIGGINTDVQDSFGALILGVNT